MLGRKKWNRYHHSRFPIHSCLLLRKHTETEGFYHYQTLLTIELSRSSNKLQIKNLQFIMLAMSGILLLVLYFRNIVVGSCYCENAQMNNFVWTFSSENGSISGKAVVTGDIYQDLELNGFITKPLYGFNDESLRWVPRTDWIYTTEFDIDESWKKYESVLLDMKGLDTAADVFFNDVLILKSKNQFIPYLLLLKSWHIGKNKLKIIFRSPINYSLQMSKMYQKQFGHSIPPDCPVTAFHGECHVNFMRKIQASFSWDWGPSFPTVGIWQPISILGVQSIFINTFSALATPSLGGFVVFVELTVYSTKDINEASISVSIPELSVSTASTVSLKGMNLNTLSTSFLISNKNLELWWPNGFGKQKLYSLNAAVIQDGHIYEAEAIRIGFRTIELIQDYVDPSNPHKGRHFYFAVNRVPIFLKGSNWIPISSFPARNHSERLNFLMQSAKEANMNTLRVWGGGRYESDEFYDLADELGILIWQDMMFACALYPVNDDFLDNVRDEITTQVKRLRHRPSILVWAGNNENELAVRSWFSAKGYSSTDMEKDYVKLYRDVIKPLVNELDSSRSYLLSSPSNGIESEKAGGISPNPSSPQWGDIHFYNEMMNLWQDETYELPRCSSEYGVQSYPRRETYLKWINESDWYYTSEQLRSRQHHPGGFAAQLLMIFSHFPIPKECSDTTGLENCEFLRQKSSGFMDRFVYYSQMHQAIAYQMQTEHYRRWRGRLDENGYGNTMCAMYWQLNDIWAAPTWSSIDFELSWKPVHYFARRFFANVILSMFFSSNGNLHIYIISDLEKSVIQGTLVLDIYTLQDGFTPINRYTKIIDIPAQTSTEVPIHDSSIFKMLRKAFTKESELYIIHGKLLAIDGQQIGYNSTVLPEQFFKMPAKVFGKTTITSFQMINSTTYKVELHADHIAPLVWMELPLGVLGWFTDNAFTMIEPTKEVYLIVNPKTVQLTANNITICSLKDCGLGGP